MTAPQRPDRIRTDPTWARNRPPRTVARRLAREQLEAAVAAWDHRENTSGHLALTVGAELASAARAMLGELDGWEGAP